MQTAIDSSVLWAIFKGEATAGGWMKQLEKLRPSSLLIICEITLAEVAPLFPTAAELNHKLQLLGVEFDPITPDAAFMAGHIFRDYRRQGGPRQHLIPDFLIGSHALTQADQLAAVDRGFLRRYFPKLKIITPP